MASASLLSNARFRYPATFGVLEFMHYLKRLLLHETGLLHHACAWRLIN